MPDSVCGHCRGSVASRGLLPLRSLQKSTYLWLIWSSRLCALRWNKKTGLLLSTKALLPVASRVPCVQKRRNVSFPYDFKIPDLKIWGPRLKTSVHFKAPIWSHTVAALAKNSFNHQRNWVKVWQFLSNAIIYRQAPEYQKWLDVWALQIPQVL